MPLLPWITNTPFPYRVRSRCGRRNWRAGDRFWQAHTKAPRKIKELLQDRHVTGHERKRWPVVASGENIVWVRGMAGPAQLQLRGANKDAVVIRELR